MTASEPRLTAMFERFTKDARRMLVIAGQEAARFASGHIGTEHMLLGALQVAPDLVELAVAPGTAAEAIRGHVEERIRAEARDAGTRGDVRPFSPHAKKVLEQSLREALRLAHKEIKVGHILLGLRDVDACMAATLLRELGSTDVQVGVLQQAVRAGGSQQVGLEYVTNAFRDLGWTPGAREVARRARLQAGRRLITTGDLLKALLEEERGVAALALAELGVTADALGRALDAIDEVGTSDGPLHPPEVVTMKIGEVEGTFTIPADAPSDSGERLKAAIASGRLAEVMGEALRSLGVDPENPPE